MFEKRKWKWNSPKRTKVACGKTHFPGEKRQRDWTLDLPKNYLGLA